MLFNHPGQPRRSHRYRRTHFEGDRFAGEGTARQILDDLDDFAVQADAESGSATPCVRRRRDVNRVEEIIIDIPERQKGVVLPRWMTFWHWTVNGRQQWSKR